MTSGRYAREILAQALKTMEPGIDRCFCNGIFKPGLSKSRKRTV